MRFCIKNFPIRAHIYSLRFFNNSRLVTVLIHVDLDSNKDNFKLYNRPLYEFLEILRIQGFPHLRIAVYVPRASSVHVLSI